VNISPLLRVLRTAPILPAGTARTSVVDADAARDVVTLAETLGVCALDSEGVGV
jgi:hypothetical protein